MAYVSPFVFGYQIPTPWFQEVDILVNGVLDGAQTTAAVLAALGLTEAAEITTLPIPIAQGGTGAVTASAGLVALGGTTLGAAVAASVTAAEAAIGTQAYLGAVIYPQTPAEAAASPAVVPTNSIWPPGWIPRYGAVADAVVSTGAGTDNSAAIASALSCVGQPTFVPPGNWGFKNIVVPNGQTFYGQGIHVSNLVALSGATGTMCTDGGSAAKTDIYGLAFYGQGNTADTGSLNVTAYTAGFKFGYGGTAHGTEGTIHDIWVRALPAGALGIDINSNVGKYSNLYAQTTAGLRIAGTGISVEGGCESYASSGFVNTASQTVLTDFGDGSVGLIEVEAGTSAVVPLFLTGNCSVKKLVWAPSSASSVDHVVEIGPSATTWDVSLQSYFQGTAGTITGGALKWTTSGAYYGATSAGGGHGQDQNYFSSVANVNAGTAVFGAAVATVAVTFPQSLGITTYKIHLAAGVASGTPAAGSMRPSWSSKAGGGFTINLEVAPGTSNSVAVDWSVTI
jgi:hypothetical protein